MKPLTEDQGDRADATAEEEEEPFDPRAVEFDAEADFAFFAAFENGYPGEDRCDEHGCWSRRIVTGPA